MERPNSYGKLINSDIKLHRQWFKQMTSLIGINCVYRPPIVGKTFDAHGDLAANYGPAQIVGCIFNEHPDQKSLKKMGWVAELQTNSSLIHVPYDLPGLQVGALFSIPSGIDGAPDRIFRVISMENIMVYPASIACEIAPEYQDIDEPNLVTDFSTENITVLIDNEEDD